MKTFTLVLCFNKIYLIYKFPFSTIDSLLFVVLMQYFDVVFVKLKNILTKYM